MRTTPVRLIACAAAVSLLPLGLAASASAAGPRGGDPGRGGDLGRQVLGQDDGWAAAEGGTTGGAAAVDEHVYTVSTWPELREALGGDSARGDTTDRIVYVEGHINANDTADGTRLTCEDYAVPGWSLEEYVADFEAWVATGADPDDWVPAEALEDAREDSADEQDEQVRQYIGSNVTLVGVGDDAQITGASLTVRSSDNVIVRNLRLSDASDCFPEWDPGDFALDEQGNQVPGGTWNSAYDNLWIATSTHVWVDHNTFDDGDNPPGTLPTVLGATFEVHDGLLDITNGSDLVTVSWNEFREHDKMMLWGSTNNPRTPGDPQSDRGRLRITMHHNLIEDSGQRTPRVRFGQVHIYNNYYVEPDADGYQYHWGVGVESQILGENNYFELDGIDPADVIYDWGGTQVSDTGTLVNGRSPVRHGVDLVAEYNAEHDPDLVDVSWTPQYVGRVHPTQAVPALVTTKAGAGVID